MKYIQYLSLSEEAGMKLIEPLPPLSRLWPLVVTDGKVKMMVDLVWVLSVGAAPVKAGVKLELF